MKGLSKAFYTYMTGTAISSVGAGLYFVALAWVTLQTGNSVRSLGWLLASSSLPGIIISPWIGVLVDRVDRRYLCSLADLARSLVMLAVAISLFFHVLSLPSIYLAAIALGIADRVYWPSSSGLVREIVDEEGLVSANSVYSMSSQLGILIGSGMCGFLLAVIGAGEVIAITSGTFLFSAACTFNLRRDKILHQAGKPRNIKADMWEGATFLKNSPELVKLYAMQLLLLLTLYGTNVLLPGFIRGSMKLGVREFGLVDAAWAVGAVVGGVALLKYKKIATSNPWIGYCMLLLSLAVAAFSASHALLAAEIGYALMGMAFVMGKIAVDSKIQAQTPVALQGRSRSFASLAIAIVSLFIYLAIGYVGDSVNVRYIYLADACLLSISAVVILLFRTSVFPVSVKGAK